MLSIFLPFFTFYAVRPSTMWHSVIVPVHANFQPANLAFRDAMDGSHEWLNMVGNTLNLVVTWYNNAPTRLRNVH